MIYWLIAILLGNIFLINYCVKSCFNIKFSWWFLMLNNFIIFKYDWWRVSAIKIIKVIPWNQKTLYWNKLYVRRITDNWSKNSTFKCLSSVLKMPNFNDLESLLKMKKFWRLFFRKMKSKKYTWAILLHVQIYINKLAWLGNSLSWSEIWKWASLHRLALSVWKTLKLVLFR